jgi:hypothetical protein
MEVRAFLQKNPAASVIGTSGAIAVALVAMFVEQRGNALPAAPRQFYFTVDDGATYFADDINRIPPFLHDGKQAVRAQVIKGATGRPFVAYLLRYSASAKADSEKLLAQQGAGARMMPPTPPSDMEVKKPLSGDVPWTRMSSPAAAAITDIRPPPGVSEPLEPALP